MTNNNGVRIKNIYHMLSYAFQVLKQSNYEEIASEEFEHMQDLFAAILAKGVAQQLKQGLHREYIAVSDQLSALRGKIDLQGTVQLKLRRRQKLACVFDELSENNLFNQILKTTAVILLRQPNVNPTRRAELKKILLFFGGVDQIEPSGIKWNMLRIQKSNQSYKMLLHVCYFVLESLLLSTEKGIFKMAAFLDEQRMSRLYEKFVLEYYRYHYPELRASASQVAWNLDDSMNAFLPVMQTDITMRKGSKILIIDTKYYTRTMQTRYDSQTLHSNNLYQIFTYVKNQDVNRTGDVSGMLLYAKTEEALAPDCDFQMSGNRISVKTLDLNTTFVGIAAQLDGIVEAYFGEEQEKRT